MSVYSLIFKPKKSAIKANGAVPLAIAIEAKTQKLATMAATIKMEEEMPGASENFFNPEIVEDKEGSPRPPIDRFDEQFPQDYDLVNGEFILKNQPVSGEYPDMGALVEFKKLSLVDKITVLLLYDKTDITQQDLSMVVDFLNDDESSAGLMPVIEGLKTVPALDAMYPESLQKLIKAVFAKYPQKFPAVSEITRFAEQWVAAPRDRVDTAQSQQPRDTNAAPICGPFKNRPFQHNFETLDLEIAVALKFDDVDCWDVGPHRVAQARRMIELDDKTFKLWSMEFRILGKTALQIPREAVFEIVRGGKAVLPSPPPAAALRDYIHQQIASIEMPETESQAPAVSPEPTDTVKTDMAPPAEQSRETLNKMGYGIYGSAPDAAPPALEHAAEPADMESASIEVEKQEVPPQADDIKLRAAELENSIARLPASAQENLSLWRQVHKTDSAFTKQFTNDGGGTSINGTYMVMRATEVFGPQGINWNVEVLEERFDRGAPLFHNATNAAGKLEKALILDGNGNYMAELNHVVKIKLRYIHDGEEGFVIAYGCTPYLYNSKYGPISDGEAPKKSLTDATKKALSQLGFSADVFLGLYDNPQYRDEISQEFAIKNASDKAEGVAQLRKELDEKLSRNAETLQSGVSPNEINAVFATIAREVEVHRKAAEAKGDQEYAKYLSGRLRRLTTIKTERLAQLAEGEKA
ncbi:hypothetical protein [Martelella alba]|uniref:Uncharacterized protein n=1 Tax=Martelella alba TaxID=2590451 RepID=A0ABY2SDJ1_9HYPH|nr:hypothetical protein [Martelella alba]TKI02566.1 hypothetical protein FCN80_24585 [Martelella alba]